jgi:hypothetical protein
MTPTRALYIARRIAIDLGSLGSRAVNAFLFGGSTAQTTSARAHVEAPHSAKWQRRRDLIDRLCFWEDDHCARSWRLEVERAEYVLSVLEADQ